MTQKIVINIIDHKDQRYPTVGDWQFKKDTLEINVSNLGTDLPGTKMNCLVALHELVEALLCKFSVPEVTEDQVDAFDIAFEESRKEGDESEPGDDLRAPYHSQHKIATDIEKYLAVALEVNWEEYEKRINEL
jgi:hypothetical protein